MQTVQSSLKGRSGWVRHLQTQTRGRLGRVTGVQRNRRYTGILTGITEFDYGGTVEPPCDFLWPMLGFPLNKGHPRAQRTRVARGRACARLCG